MIYWPSQRYIAMTPNTNEKERSDKGRNRPFDEAKYIIV